MSDTDYDIVIVGAGIIGSIIAKTVVDNAPDNVKNILILEAGEGTGATAEGYREYVDHYYTQVARVPNAPYPDNPNAPAANVLELSPIPPEITDGYLVQKGPIPFLSDYTRAQGGTTLHWLGTCLRMLPNDFHMKTLYGHGEDWPITYEELRPYYERAEREIGVSANVDEQIYPNMGPDYFGVNYQYPMQKIPQSYLDQKFSTDIEGLSVNIDGQTDPIDVMLVSTPQGRNSTPNANYNNGEGYVPVGMVGDPELGQRCEGNSSCVPICPVQAKYNALKTLNAIPLDRVNVEIRTKCVASNVNIDSATGNVSGITYKAYADKESSEHIERTVTAKKYVLAAHAIENAKLLLASEAANSSDQVGRNLMDHLVMLTWGYMPYNIGAFRGPGSTSGIASFRDGDFRRELSSFRVELGNWGWSWPTGAPLSDLTNYIDNDNLYGTALRERLVRNVPRQFRIGWEGEQLPEATNRVTIDQAYMDQLGNYRPVINYDIGDYTRAGLAQAKRIADQLSAYIGVEDETSYSSSDPGYFEYQGQGYTANGAGHLVGTHRMGSDSNTSVVDPNQRSWDHPNLYIAGCGSMTTLGTSNPTLTAAALAIKTGDSLLNDFRKGT